MFLCILHCSMAMGRLFVAFIEAEVQMHPPEIGVDIVPAPVWGETGVTSSTGQGGDTQLVLGLGLGANWPLVGPHPRGRHVGVA